MVSSPRYGTVHGSSRSLGYMGSYTEHIDNHDGRADGNSRVGDIERPEMMTTPIDVDEIDHRSDDHAIDEIPRGAADDEREPDSRQDLVARQTGRIHPHSHKRS